MSERDELRADLLDDHGYCVNCGEDAEDCECAFDGFIDATLAAGWRKPYLVTTSTELEALPNHSVIVDKDADIWQKRGDEWCSYETNPHIDVRLLKYAPLTVIHEGGTP